MIVILNSIVFFLTRFFIIYIVNDSFLCDVIEEINFLIISSSRRVIMLFKNSKKAIENSKNITIHLNFFLMNRVHKSSFSLSFRYLLGIRSISLSVKSIRVILQSGIIDQ